MRFSGKLLFLAACALAAGCSTPQPGPAERVELVWNRTDDVHRACEGLTGRKELFTVLGCSRWRVEAKPGEPRACVIYAPQPRSERDVQRFATLGHELMHCFDGNWHDRWGRMLPPDKFARRDGASGEAGSGSTRDAAGEPASGAE